MHVSSISGAPTESCPETVRPPERHSGSQTHCLDHHCPRLAGVLAGTVRQPEGGGQQAGRGDGAGPASGLRQLRAHVLVPLHIPVADSSVASSKLPPPRTSAP